MPPSENVRKVLWLMLVEPEFMSAIDSGNLRSAAAAHGIELSDEDARQIEQLDREDLDDLLSRVDRDVSVIMGGSRPRTQLALSEETIQELRQALGEND